MIKSEIIVQGKAFCIRGTAHYHQCLKLIIYLKIVNALIKTNYYQNLEKSL